MSPAKGQHNLSGPVRGNALMSHLTVLLQYRALAVLWGIAMAIPVIM